MIKLLRTIFIFLFCIFFFQSFIINIYHSLVNVDNQCQEESKYLKSSLGNAVLHNRSWSNVRSVNGFCMEYGIADESMNSAMESRNSIVPVYSDYYYEYWGSIYKSLHELNQNDLTVISDSLEIIRNSNEMSRSEFAYLMVSFIQDIPYSYIKTESCDLLENGKPCKGNSKFGLLSPTEFLHTLQGDCDTRTVLLYSLLNSFGYSPLILVSKEYMHSIIALDIPATGEFIQHKGRKFYLWETTNTGWEPGMIAPDMKNINYWNIALDYEY